VDSIRQDYGFDRHQVAPQKGNSIKILPTVAFKEKLSVPSIFSPQNDATLNSTGISHDLWVTIFTTNEKWKTQLNCQYSRLCLDLKRAFYCNLFCRIAAREKTRGWPGRPQRRAGLEIGYERLIDSG
jgi:hypothetical protein